jgi:hypothetical protein
MQDAGRHRGGCEQAANLSAPDLRAAATTWTGGEHSQSSLFADYYLTILFHNVGQRRSQPATVPRCKHPRLSSQDHVGLCEVCDFFTPLEDEIPYVWVYLWALPVTTHVLIF